MTVPCIFPLTLWYAGEYYICRRHFPIVQEGKIVIWCCWVYDVVCTPWHTIKLPCNSLFPGYWHFIGESLHSFVKEHMQDPLNCIREENSYIPFLSLHACYFPCTSRGSEVSANILGFQTHQTCTCCMFLNQVCACSVCFVQSENIMLQLMLLCAFHLLCFPFVVLWFNPHWGASHPNIPVSVKHVIITHTVSSVIAVLNLL